MDDPKTLARPKYRFQLGQPKGGDSPYYATDAIVSVRDDKGEQSAIYRLEKIEPPGPPTQSTLFFAYKAHLQDPQPNFQTSFYIRLPYFTETPKDRKRMKYEEDSLLIEINALRRLEALELVPNVYAPLSTQGNQLNQTNPGQLSESYLIQDFGEQMAEGDGDQAYIRGLPIRLSDGTSLTVPHSIRSYLDGVTVRTWVDEAKRRAKDKKKIIKTREWLIYAKEITEALRRMHRERVTHGYLSPDNVIVERHDVSPDRPRSPKFVNFENKFFFAPSSGLVLDDDHAALRRPYDSPQKKFHQDGPLIVSDGQSRNADWYVSSDIFSLGLHLLYLLLGEEGSICPLGDEVAVQRTEEDVNFPKIMRILDENPKSSTLFKRELYRMLKARAESTKEAIALMEILFAYLRVDANRQLADLDQVLNTIEQFSDGILQPGTEAASAGVNPDTLASLLADLDDVAGYGKSFTEYPRDLAEPIGNIVLWRTRQFRKDVGEIDPPNGERLLYTIRGGRGQIIDSMVQATRGLRAGWTLDAVTSPTFWFDTNLRVGRFASRLLMAAEDGARIRWRLVVRELDLNELDVARAMRSLLYITIQLGPDRTNWDWQWTCVPDTQYNSFLRKKESFLHLYEGEPALSADRKPLYSGLLIAPDFRVTAGQLTTLRVWDARNSKRLDGLRKPFFQERPAFNFWSLQRYPHRTTFYA